MLLSVRLSCSGHEYLRCTCDKSELYNLHNNLPVVDLRIAANTWRVFGSTLARLSIKTLRWPLVALSRWRLETRCAQEVLANKTVTWCRVVLVTDAASLSQHVDIFKSENLHNSVEIKRRRQIGGDGCVKNWKWRLTNPEDKPGMILGDTGAVSWG